MTTVDEIAIIQRCAKQARTRDFLYGPCHQGKAWLWITIAVAIYVLLLVGSYAFYFA